jgi:hypothetical protein
LIDHLKKSDMANEAKCLLDGSGWPEPLRLAEVASAPAAWVSMARSRLIEQCIKPVPPQPPMGAAATSR